MKNDLQVKLTQLEELILVQRNCLERGYMHGLLNGMIMAHAIFDNSEPDFVATPSRNPRHIKIRHKSRKIKLKEL